MTLEEVIQAMRSLTPEEQRLVTKMFSKNKRGIKRVVGKRGRHTAKEQSKRRDLYGIYSGLVPENFDVDSALNEIRRAWQKELFQIVG